MLANYEDLPNYPDNRQTTGRGTTANYQRTNERSRTGVKLLSMVPFYAKVAKILAKY